MNGLVILVFVGLALGGIAPVLVLEWLDRRRIPSGQCSVVRIGAPLPPAQPPGQLTLWRPIPRARQPRWCRVVTATGRQGDPTHALTEAATKAALVAHRDGEAWLIADDRTYAYLRLTETGLTVSPDAGWPTSVARIVHRYDPDRSSSP